MSTRQAPISGFELREVPNGTGGTNLRFAGYASITCRDANDLAHVYEVTPDFSVRLVRALPQRDDARSYLEEVLREDWGFAIEPEPFETIAALLGV